MIISAFLTVFLLSLASALPPPTTETISPPKGHCLCSDGTVLSKGDPAHKLSDCGYCACTSEGMHEIFRDCPRPQCVDYYSVEGDGICCPTCPNGPTSEAYHGPNRRTRAVIKADGDGIYCPKCLNEKNCETFIGGNRTIIPDGQTINISAPVTSIIVATIVSIIQKRPV